MKTIKYFLKPSRVKLILFLAAFTVIFFELPFARELPAEINRSMFFFIRNNSWNKIDIYFLTAGVIIYFLSSYFISCSFVEVWKSFRTKN